MSTEEPDILDCNDTVAERYDVVDKIGIGGMAQVYKAIDLSTGAEVALKICKRQGADQARFTREIELMHSATHDHIMPVLDHGSHEGLPFLIMPLAQHCLKDVHFHDTDKGTVADGLRSFLEICEGVKSLHSKGVIHRDIKPHNILQVDGKWVVSDLGFGKDLKKANATLTRTGMRLGTEVYMSPEQHKGDTKNITEKSDLSQLGLVLYQMFTGDIPLRADPLDIPDPEVRNIYLRCTKNKPENRYASISAVIADAQHIINTYEGPQNEPDSLTWLDSPQFSETCRREIRQPYGLVRKSSRWQAVLSKVTEHWRLLFESFDHMFQSGITPTGCKPGKGVPGVISSTELRNLSEFSTPEIAVIQWLSLRRVVFAATRKYSSLAKNDTDALMVLFFNYIKPSEVTPEFLRQQGWRGHVTRMRPFFTKLGIKPSELALGAAAVSTLGELEREWLDTLAEGNSSLPAWWYDLHEKTAGAVLKSKRLAASSDSIPILVDGPSCIGEFLAHKFSPVHFVRQFQIRGLANIASFRLQKIPRTEGAVDFIELFYDQGGLAADLQTSQQLDLISRMRAEPGSTLTQHLLLRQRFVTRYPSVFERCLGWSER